MENEVVKSKSGRKPGVPNRTTRQSRQAIAMFIEQNIPRLDGWLQQVAEGIPKLDMNGEPLRDQQGSIVFVVRPAPIAAIKAISDIADFHLPRLVRSDVQSVHHIEGAALNVDQMTSEQLRRLIADRTGITIEGETVVEPLPDWIAGTGK